MLVVVVAAAAVAFAEGMKIVAGREAVGLFENMAMLMMSSTCWPHHLIAFLNAKIKIKCKILR